MPKIAEAFVEISARMGKLTQKLAMAQVSTKRAMAVMAAAAKKAGAAIGRAMRSAFSSVVKWAKRALLALTALATYIAVKSVKAWAIQEKAVATLSGALKGIGKHTAAGMKDLQAFASELQTVSTIGDETTLAVMAMGASLSGLTGGPLKDLTVAALGLSKVIGSDLRTAMMLLARATKGEFTLFSRYGIKLDETKTKQEQFNTVFAASLAGLKIEEAQLETLSGRWAQLKNASGDALEQIGRILTTGAGGASLADGLARITDRVSEWVYELESVPGVADKVAKAFKEAFSTIHTDAIQMAGHVKRLFLDLEAKALDFAHAFKGTMMGASPARETRYAAALYDIEKRRLTVQKEIASQMRLARADVSVPELLRRGAEGEGSPFFEWGRGRRRTLSERFGGAQAPTINAVGGNGGADALAKALVTSVQTALGSFKVGQKTRQLIVAEKSLKTQDDMKTILSKIQANTALATAGGFA